MRLSKPLLLSQVVLWAVSAGVGGEPTLEEIRVAPEGRGFVLFPSGARFVPWGFNYDHDERSRLLEDYWEMEWPKVAEDFREMKALGANAVRIHLQLGKFLKGANEPNPQALQRLEKLIALAEETGLYLNLTGLGCYRKQDVPGWYQALEESERWGVQVRFWEEVAARCVGSRAIFCYDLMNEPVVAGGKRSAGDWLGPPFGEFHFVQFITLDPRGRRRPEIARAWINTLTRAIRRVDPRGLVTVGLVDWSLDRPGLTSGFVPAAVAPELDFLSVHIYPESGKLDEAVVTLEEFAAVGKPVVIEETFPLKCGVAEFRRFLDRSRPHAAGWFGFYWGKSPEELRRSGTIADHMMLGSLELFQELAPSIAKAGLDPSD